MSATKKWIEDSIPLNARKLAQAMVDLRTAFATVDRLTEDMSPEVADIFCVEYPFKQSFPDMDYEVHVWVSEFLENLKKGE